MFYIITILTASLLIIAANAIFLSPAVVSVGEIALSVAVGVLAIIAEDGLSALILRRLTPTAWYSPDVKVFNVSRKEQKFYRSIKIKKWKDLVPELGLFTGFSKNDLKSTDDHEYLSRFLLESNYGVIIHLANGLLGFVIMFIPLCSTPSIWIPIFIVNLILSLMPVAVLRYTSCTLSKLYSRSREKIKK